MGRLAWILLLLGGCARAHAPVPAVQATAPRALPAAVDVRDARLLPALRLLLDRSPELARSLEALDHRRARVRIHTYESAPQPARIQAAFAYGYTHPFFDDRGRIDSIDVAIQWGRLQFAGRALGLGAEQIRTEIAVLLGHELFGHAVPLLQQGTAAGECPDATANGESCSLPRENAIRAALGVSPRSDYQLVCLGVTRTRDLGVAATRIPDRPGCPGTRNTRVRASSRAGR